MNKCYHARENEKGLTCGGWGVSMCWWLKGGGLRGGLINRPKCQRLGHMWSDRPPNFPYSRFLHISTNYSTNISHAKHNFRSTYIHTVLALVCE